MYTWRHLIPPKPTVPSQLPVGINYRQNKNLNEYLSGFAKSPTYSSIILLPFLSLFYLHQMFCKEPSQHAPYVLFSDWIYYVGYNLKGKSPRLCSLCEITRGLGINITHFVEKCSGNPQLSNQSLAIQTQHTLHNLNLDI